MPLAPRVPPPSPSTMASLARRRDGLRAGRGRPPARAARRPNRSHREETEQPRPRFCSHRRLLRQRWTRCSSSRSPSAAAAGSTVGTPTDGPPYIEPGDHRRDCVPRRRQLGALRRPLPEERRGRCHVRRGQRGRGRELLVRRHAVSVRSSLLVIARHCSSLLTSSLSSARRWPFQVG